MLAVFARMSIAPALVARVLAMELIRWNRAAAMPARVGHALDFNLLRRRSKIQEGKMEMVIMAKQFASEGESK